MMNFISLFIGFTVLFSSCRENGKKEAGKKTEKQILTGPQNYHIQSPDATWELPSALNEISGIGLLNDSIMVCQQDENGILYLYNLVSKQIDKTIPFGKPNDYEDLAILGTNVYVLQSNGTVVQVSNYLQAPVIIKHKTALTRKNDTEGICYDSVSKTFLVTCKADQGAEAAAAAQNIKAIYAFNLQTKEISNKPLIVFEEKEFKPSAVAVNPLTGNIFVLSASKRRLLEVNRQGTIVQRYELKGNLFKQPEGLTFSSNADLYISNEGKGGKANILLFHYQKKVAVQ